MCILLFLDPLSSFRAIVKIIFNKDNIFFYRKLDLAGTYYIRMNQSKKCIVFTI